MARSKELIPGVGCLSHSQVAAHCGLYKGLKKLEKPSLEIPAEHTDKSVGGAKNGDKHLIPSLHKGSTLLSCRGCASTKGESQITKALIHSPFHHTGYCFDLTCRALLGEEGGVPEAVREQIVVGYRTIQSQQCTSVMS